MNRATVKRIATLLGMPLNTPEAEIMEEVQTTLDLARRLAALVVPARANSNDELNAAEKAVCSHMGLSPNDFNKSRISDKTT